MFGHPHVGSPARLETETACNSGAILVRKQQDVPTGACGNTKSFIPPSSSSPPSGTAMTNSISLIWRISFSRVRSLVPSLRHQSLLWRAHFRLVDLLLSHRHRYFSSSFHHDPTDPRRFRYTRDFNPGISNSARPFRCPQPVPLCLQVLSLLQDRPPYLLNSLLLILHGLVAKPTYRQPSLLPILPVRSAPSFSVLEFSSRVAHSKEVVGLRYPFHESVLF